jgi:hypothetical protein
MSLRMSNMTSLVSMSSANTHKPEIAQLLLHVLHELRGHAAVHGANLVRLYMFE